MHKQTRDKDSEVMKFILNEEDRYLLDIDGVASKLEVPRVKIIRARAIKKFANEKLQADILDGTASIHATYMSLNRNKELPKRTKSPALSFDDVRDILKLDKTSPTWLTWKHCKNSNFTGLPAGSISENASVISVHGSMYTVASIVWLLKHKKFPPSDKFVYHVDGNPYNNDPSNLELVTRGQQTRRSYKKSFRVRLLKDGSEVYEVYIHDPETGNRIFKTYRNKDSARRAVQKFTKQIKDKCPDKF